MHGFIGKNLSEAIRERENLTLVEYKRNDDLIKVITLVKPDVVFHLAAIPLVSNGNIEEVVKSNILLTQKVCEAMPARSHMIFSSSATVYGNLVDGRASSELDIPCPKSMYGATKLASESIINSYVLGGKITACVVRLVTNIGPYATHGVLPDLIDKAKRAGDYLEVLGDCPGSSKSYLHVSDTVKALMMLLDSNTEGVYNIGALDIATVEQIAISILVRLGINKSIKWLGAKANWVGDDNRVQLNVDKIYNKIGWYPRYHSMQAIDLALESSCMNKN